MSETGIATLVNDLAMTIRENPLPSALIGMGLAMTFVGVSSSRADDRPRAD
jgi:hypothetical protein